MIIHIYTYTYTYNRISFKKRSSSQSLKAFLRYVTGEKAVCYWGKSGMLLGKKRYVTGGRNFFEKFLRG
jgi:hypothetical protein